MFKDLLQRIASADGRIINIDKSQGAIRIKSISLRKSTRWEAVALRRKVPEVFGNVENDDDTDISETVTSSNNE